MLRPSTRIVWQVLCAGAMFFGASATSQGCLFPCLWGHWGWGPAYPPPVYAQPAYYAPAYPAPCSPCGPGGCGAFYGPSPCGCAPCGGSACASGNCASGNCGVNYAPGNDPVADPNGPPRTYSEDPEQTGPDTSTDTMPDDDFGPTRRNGDNSTGAEEVDPFTQPVLPQDGAAPADPDMAPMDEDMLDGNITLRVMPVRTRVHAVAQYHLPRVARVDVTPQTPWSAHPESRVASK